ncbi:YncE family protein [Vulgatibacter incomptus]|uniref:Tryptophan synthase alpha chain n=1 Tax=Vulgatibacter incomptus TaxID=1391653 RepID=A0A0K1PFZ2_9BACT|nr:hypothetical protein [Vulgatibacter incomptus]AKU92453.1 hypothetical protein AKJ08_2840 [Vulgatibacter incomptus]
MDAECGLVSNNCGEMLDCGTCAAGLACDSNHRCGACEPLSCTGLCGEVSDDCGSTLDCGPCPRGDSIDIKANGLVSDRSRGKLYVSLPSSFGADGNSVAILDPASGLLEATLFVGSEPTVLAISDDSSTLYVGLAGAPRVVKVDLATFSVVGQFDLRTDSRSGPLFAEQIAVVPGAPDSVAVSTWIKGVSPRHAGVGIWDGGVRRDSMTPGHTGANRIAFTGSPGVLYGYNNESTEFGFRTFAVKPNGLEEVSVVPRVISGFYLDIKSSGDRILSTAGDLVDPTRPSLLGTYGASGPIESDLSTRLTYVVSSDWRTRNTSIEIFDRERFVPRGRVDLGTLPDGLADLVRWGDRGLAFRAGGKIVFVENPLIAGER